MRLEKRNVQRIRTPEGVVFSLPLAGLMSRVLARLIDMGIMLAVIVSLYFIFSVLGVITMFISALGTDVLLAILMVAVFFVMFGYNIIFEWFWKGQTPGKKVFRLRVVDEFGLGLRFNQVAIRNLLRVADALPIILLPICYPFGVASILLSRCNQRLGDRVAGTIVVAIPRLTQPDWAEILAGKFNSFREHAHLAARLRQAVTPKEAELALQCLLRRDQLSPPARAELFAQFAEHFRERVRMPEEAVFGLSDEKYIRNVVEVVLNVQHEEAQELPAAEPAADIA